MAVGLVTVGVTEEADLIELTNCRLQLQELRELPLAASARGGSVHRTQLGREPDGQAPVESSPHPGSSRADKRSAGGLLHRQGTQRQLRNGHASSCPPDSRAGRIAPVLHRSLVDRLREHGCELLYGEISSDTLKFFLRAGFLYVDSYANRRVPGARIDRVVQDLHVPSGSALHQSAYLPLLSQESAYGRFVEVYGLLAERLFKKIERMRHTGKSGINQSVFAHVENGLRFIRDLREQPGQTFAATFDWNEVETMWIFHDVGEIGMDRDIPSYKKTKLARREEERKASRILRVSRLVSSGSLWCTTTRAMQSDRHALQESAPTRSTEKQRSVPSSTRWRSRSSSGVLASARSGRSASGRDLRMGCSTSCAGSVHRAPQSPSTVSRRASQICLIEPALGHRPGLPRARSDLEPVPRGADERHSDGARSRSSCASRTTLVSTGRRSNSQRRWSRCSISAAYLARWTACSRTSDAGST